MERDEYNEHGDIDKEYRYDNEGNVVETLTYEYVPCDESIPSNPMDYRGDKTLSFIDGEYFFIRVTKTDMRTNETETYWD